MTGDTVEYILENKKKEIFNFLEKNRVCAHNTKKNVTNCGFVVITSNDLKRNND